MDTNPFAGVLQASAEKRRRKETYIDSCFIVATSCDIERLFSKAKLLLGNLRTRMHPKHLEALLILSVNRDRGDVETVEKAIRKKVEEEPEENLNMPLDD